MMRTLVFEKCALYHKMPCNESLLELCPIYRKNYEKCPYLLKIELIYYGEDLMDVTLKFPLLDKIPDHDRFWDILTDYLSTLQQDGHVGVTRVLRPEGRAA